MTVLRDTSLLILLKKIDVRRSGIVDDSQWTDNSVILHDRCKISQERSLLFRDHFIPSRERDDKIMTAADQNTCECHWHDVDVEHRKERNMIFTIRQQGNENFSDLQYSNRFRTSHVQNNLRNIFIFIFPFSNSFLVVPLETLYILLFRQKRIYFTKLFLCTLSCFGASIQSLNILLLCDSASPFASVCSERLSLIFKPIISDCPHYVMISDTPSYFDSFFYPLLELINRVSTCRTKSNVVGNRYTDRLTNLTSEKDTLHDVYVE